MLKKAKQITYFISKILTMTGKSLQGQRNVELGVHNGMEASEDALRLEAVVV